MFLLKQLAYLFRILFRLPFNLFRYARLAWNAPYPASEKWQIFQVFVGLWVKAFFNRDRTQIRHYKIFGFTVYGYGYTSLSNLFEEIFVSNIYHFTATTPQPVIIDCGANIGFATLYFKKLYPEARILAFEPDPESFALLQRNVTENNLQQVELYNVALADTAGTTTFYQADRKAGLTSSLSAERGGAREITIAVEKLSEFIRPFENADLVKMDIEGAEVTVIKELRESGSLRKARNYLIEYHHSPVKNHGELAGFLAAFSELNFNFRIVEAYLHLPAQQDIIFHFRQEGKA